MAITTTSGVTDHFLPSGGGVGAPLPGLKIVALGNHTIDQGPSAVDTAYTVLFGPGGSVTGDMVINPNGTWTCNTTGDYFFSMNLTYGRTTSSGTAQMHIRVLLNGAQVGGSGDNYFTNANDKLTKGNSFVFSLTATDIVTIQLIRDSTGTNNGGLIASSPTAPGWAITPSATIAIYKLT